MSNQKCSQCKTFVPLLSVCVAGIHIISLCLLSVFKVVGGKQIISLNYFTLAAENLGKTDTKQDTGAAKPKEAQKPRKKFDFGGVYMQQ